jgi:CheY-like chemotaxis protein
MPPSMSILRPPSSPVILVVDDDPGDRILIQEALEASPIRNEVRLATNGEEALAYFQRLGPFADPGSSPRPALVLLDLNMPRVGGKDVLAFVKSEPRFKSIPVVAFTTSALEQDIVDCYRLGANSYVQKPTDFHVFQSVLYNLQLYWLQVSLPPPLVDATPR